MPRLSGWTPGDWILATQLPPKRHKEVCLNDLSPNRRCDLVGTRWRLIEDYGDDRAILRPS